jgi:hypothetical protein
MSVIGPRPENICSQGAFLSLTQPAVGGPNVLRCKIPYSITSSARTRNDSEIVSPTRSRIRQSIGHVTLPVPQATSYIIVTRSFVGGA